MSLSAETEREVRKLLEEGYHSSYVKLNWLLWSLGIEGFSAACRIADDLDKSICPDQVAIQQELRQRWPDPKAALGFLPDVDPRFPLAGEPLRSGGQAEAYVLLDFARWANADPELILGIIEDIRQQTVSAGEAGYARLLYKNHDSRSWPEEGLPRRNQRCFVASSLSRYTQYAPATCRLVYLPGIHSMAGGYYNYKRLGPGFLNADAGQFAFFGLTTEAMEAAHSRQSALSHRIYEGGWE